MAVGRPRSDEKIRWERVLGKFTLGELPDVAKNQLGLEVLPKARSKKELVALLVNSCLERDLTPADLLALELCRKPSQDGVGKV